jgi:hypothetical protein
MCVVEIFRVLPKLALKVPFVIKPSVKPGLLPWSVISKTMANSFSREKGLPTKPSREKIRLEFRATLNKSPSYG